MSHDQEALICSILERYPVQRAALFGSYARGEMTETSDIDILVEFLPIPIGILYFGLCDELERSLQKKVDVITYKALTSKGHPSFKENALRDERIIYERTR